jgi:hypothetical protein
MDRLEAIALLLGTGLMVIATAAVDWRAGAFLAGIFLVSPVIDPRRRS